MCRTAVKAIMAFQKISHLSVLFVCMENLPVFYLFTSGPFLWPLFDFAWMYKISTFSPITIGKLFKVSKTPLWCFYVLGWKHICFYCVSVKNYLWLSFLQICCCIKSHNLLEKQKDMMLNCSTVITIWIERLLFFSFLWKAYKEQMHPLNKSKISDIYS